MIFNEEESRSKISTHEDKLIDALWAIQRSLEAINSGIGTIGLLAIGYTIYKIACFVLHH